MPVKAYRVINFDLALPETFDVAEDVKLVQFFRDKAKLLVVLDNKGVGIYHIPTEVVERAMAEVTTNLEVKEMLRRDLEWAKERSADVIPYLFVGG